VANSTILAHKYGLDGRFGYKVAAQMGERYYGALRKFDSDVSRNVTENLWVRHIKPLFIN